MTSFTPVRMLIGVGNRLLGDDGAGPEVAEQLSGTDWVTIPGGTAIENVAGLVAKRRPALLVIVDAARMGLPPGSVRRLPRPSGDRMLASTHALPLSFLLDRLGESAAETVLIGVEPDQLTPDAGLSPAVASGVAWLVDQLREGSIDGVPQLR